jgi:replication factor C subunit 3/5
MIFLQNVSEYEKLNLSEKTLLNVQKLFKSDIRSMLNYMQSNQNRLECDLKIIDNQVWERLMEDIEKKTAISVLNDEIHEISQNYNIDKKNLLKYFLNFIIRNRIEIVNREFLYFVENIMHFQDCKSSHFIQYFLIKISVFF